MARLSNYDLWSAKNKSNQGFSEPLIEKDLVAVRTSKQQEYDSLKNQVTDSEKIRMREIMYSSKSQIEFLSRLEDEGINILYLVALGITSEEDIQSYQTLRDRGIDTYGIQEKAREKKVNSDYLREMEMLKKDYPNLLNIKGENIQRTLNSPDYLKEKPVVQKIAEPPKKTKGNIQDVPKVDIDIDALTEAMGEQGSTEEEILSAKLWKDRFQEIIDKSSKTKEGVPLESPDITSLQEPSMFLDLAENVRNVYILANPFPTPIIEGYNFRFIEDSASFGRFSVNRNNLLIITSDVPRYLLNDFGLWLSGVIKKGEKFRIATLRTSPVDLDVVQSVLFGLDKESLDKFYTENDISEYIGETAGKFKDLTSIIDMAEDIEKDS